MMDIRLYKVKLVEQQSHLEDISWWVLWLILTVELPLKHLHRSLFPLHKRQTLAGMCHYNHSIEIKMHLGHWMKNHPGKSAASIDDVLCS